MCLAPSTLGAGVPTKTRLESSIKYFKLHLIYMIAFQGVSGLAHLVSSTQQTLTDLQAERELHAEMISDHNSQPTTNYNIARFRFFNGANKHDLRLCLAPKHQRCWVRTLSQIQNKWVNPQYSFCMLWILQAPSQPSVASSTPRPTKASLCAQ